MEPEIVIARFLHRFEKSQDRINTRLRDFKNIQEDQFFEELAFCLLTPQSKARSADTAIQKLKENNFLIHGTAEEIQPLLTGVRFHITKSQRIVEAREKFQYFEFDFSDIQKLRENIVNEFKGIGYKESSHFLRNIGYGEDLAILDRHILKNMVQAGIIGEVPKTLTPKIYLELEQKLRAFCAQHNLTLGQIDLLFWSQETGEIFK
jgi:N-glycosylase/DNA lyase|tara:strand:+ start:286 stop:903 length:618 start_codon:yes stop_codon:yes gene_type:complete